MKPSLRFLTASLAVFVLSAAIAGYSSAQNKSIESAKRAVVEPSETDQLAWQNLRLKVELGRSEAKRLRSEADRIDDEANRVAEQADKKLTEIGKIIGEDYAPFFEQGKLVFKLKPKEEKKP